MIIDLQRFITEERQAWSELEALLDRIEADLSTRLTLDEIRRFHYLYQRASADLAKLNTFAAERELSRYLEGLVARAYGEIHQTSARAALPFQPWQWFLKTFPRTFRRHLGAFWLSLAITLAGCSFGALALLLDPGSKPVLLPFAHLAQTPAERVANERLDRGERLAGHKTSFSAQLMTHNIRVSVLTFSLGMSYGVGTITLLFYNGVILGAVGADYIAGGQTPFLLGWLLPHGVIEIPAILLAGQAGLMLAGALIGWGRRLTLRRRLTEIAPDLVTMIFGLAVMLVWAGLVEAFLSQYHEPVIPYAAKILFGVAELALLVFYLGHVGHEPQGQEGRGQ